MKRNDLIRELIPKLDFESDSWLIDILKERIEPEYDKYNGKSFVTNNEKRIAKQTLTTISKGIVKELEDGDGYFQKLRSLVNKSSDCETCKHSITKEFNWQEGFPSLRGKTYQSWDESRIGCKRCVEKVEKLEDYQFWYSENAFKYPIDIIENKEEIIEYKALINKTKRKINETRKHKINV